MKFIKKPGLVSALLLMGLLTMPAIAQQEVSPDHFDDHPAASQGKKPAQHKAAAAASSRTTGKSGQSKSKPAETTVLKADAGKGQNGQNPR